MSQYQLFTPSRIAAWLGLALKAVLLVAAIVVIFHVLQSRYDQLRVAGQQPVPQLVSAQDRMQQLDCLTRNIYWEAASEPFESKVGVAQVTLNRVESGRFASSVCGVVYQKNVVYDRVFCQFSWYCENSYKTRPIHKTAWRESEEVAKKVLLEGFRLPGLKEALFYHATTISPRWKNEKLATFGGHIFYK
jgi:spore germination cell wall hydrolase CwlJ-like protein